MQAPPESLLTRLGPRVGGDIAYPNCQSGRTRPRTGRVGRRPLIASFRCFSTAPGAAVDLGRDKILISQGLTLLGDVGGPLDRIVSEQEAAASSISFSRLHTCLPALSGFRTLARRTINDICKTSDQYRSHAGLR